MADSMSSRSRLRPVDAAARLRVVPRELVLVLAGIVFYFGGRGLTESSPGPAMDHARDVVAFEKGIGLYLEPALQDLIDKSQPLVTFMNWIYIWGHWPVIAGVLLWLVLRHPRTYRRTRNAMAVSGGVGMFVFVLYPLAPPRLAGLDVVDTVTLHSHAYRVLQPPGFVNQYAAMPSLHFGWDLLMGIALVTAASRRLVRVVGYVLPLLMAAAVVLTANHYIVDVVAGGSLALVGLAAAYRLERRGARVIALPQQAAPPAVESPDDTAPQQQAL